MGIQQAGNTSTPHLAKGCKSLSYSRGAYAHLPNDGRCVETEAGLAMRDTSVNKQAYTHPLARHQ
ncbi:hypothetical protein BaRGS_00018503, partial [Batillaria attramentaria]